MGALPPFLVWVYWAVTVGTVVYLVQGVLTVGHRHHIAEARRAVRVGRSRKPRSPR